MAVILFRDDQGTRDEYLIAHNHFHTVNRRSSVPNGQMVIGRYSVLPYYQELEDDLAHNDCMLINTYRQHKYIADFEWYQTLKDVTFRTWPAEQFAMIPKDVKQFVIKGKTNSRKFDWDTLMFAPDRAAAIDIIWKLQSDPLIGPQGVIVREYVPLVTHEIGINGMRMTDEYRVFFVGGQPIDFGYYWSIIDDDSKISQWQANFVNRGGYDLACNAALAISDFCNFCAIDVAQTEDGRWVVVEVNDGQMSGLSTINADQFYCNLKSVLENVTLKF